MIKKISIIFAMVFLITSAAFANDLNKKIVIKHDNNIVETEYIAKIFDNKIKIPISLIKNNLYQNTVIDDVKKQVIFSFTMPKIKFDNDKANNLLFNGFKIMYPIENGYITINKLNSLLGFSIDEENDKLIINSNVYSYYNPIKVKYNLNNNTNFDKVVMVWQPILNDKAIDSKIPSLNIVSPSWFSVTTMDGMIDNKVDYTYIDTAKKNNYKIWPLITNSFDPDLTHKFLNNKKSRKNIIKQLVVYAGLYELDGINFDFENIYEEDREALNQFMLEATSALHDINVKVSIDVTVPINDSQWSKCYDRQSLGKIVDYVVLMAYDEHWRTSQVSGSVASLPWVEQGIINTIKDIPNEKLVLGIPFYMREWQEKTVDGKVKVQAKTVAMHEIDSIIKEKNLKPTWLEDKGQFYVQYYQNDILCKIWIENEKSLDKKIDLIDKYKLAGVAAWRKDFEKPEVWNLIEEKMTVKHIEMPEIVGKKHKKTK